MNLLPPEIITRMFKHIEESGLTNSFEWWTLSDDVHRTFGAISEVCKTWNALSGPFRAFYEVVNVAADELYYEGRTGGLRRNGRELSKSIPPRSLLLEWKDCMEELEEIPLSFCKVLSTAEHSLTSLSIQGYFLQLACQQSDDDSDNTFKRILKRIKRLRIYSNDYSWFSRIPSPATVTRIAWRDLAKSVWGSGRTVPLTELALDSVMIIGECDLEDTYACPAEAVHFTDVYWEEESEYSELFPSSKYLIWSQIGRAKAERWKEIPSKIKYSMACKVLKHLFIVWWTSHPFDFNKGKGIVSSPTLHTLYLQHIRYASPPAYIDFDPDRDLNPPYRILDFLPGDNMTNLQELRIDLRLLWFNWQEQKTVNDEALEEGPTTRDILSKKFENPAFCPKLSRFPERNLPEGCLALFLGKLMS